MAEGRGPQLLGGAGILPFRQARCKPKRHRQDLQCEYRGHLRTMGAGVFIQLVHVLPIAVSLDGERQ